MLFVEELVLLRESFSNEILENNITHDTFIFEVEIYIQRYIQIIVKKAHLYETELYDHC